MAGAPPPLIEFNKPHNVLCQFTGDNGTSTQPEPSNASPQQKTRETLADYIEQPGYYAAGRLDRDSEGLLLLTNDGKLQHRISHPRHKVPKTYVVQVDGCIDSSAISTLQQGVMLKDGLTARAEVSICAEPDWLWPRNPPIRTRKDIPVSWISLTITEGKNRQIRRMTAAVGYPTLRLIRTRIGQWSIDGLAVGQWRFHDSR